MKQILLVTGHFIASLVLLACDRPEHPTNLVVSSSSPDTLYLELVLASYLKNANLLEAIALKAARQDSDYRAAEKAFQGSPAIKKEEARQAADSKLRLAFDKWITFYDAEFKKLSDSNAKILAQDVFAFSMQYDWQARTFDIRKISDVDQNERYYFKNAQAYSTFVMSSIEEAKKLNDTMAEARSSDSSLWLKFLRAARLQASNPLSCSSLGLTNKVDYLIRVRSTGPYSTETHIFNIDIRMDRPHMLRALRTKNPIYPPRYLSYSKWLSTDNSWRESERVHVQKYIDEAKIILMEFRIASVELLGCDGNIIGIVNDNRFLWASKP